MPMLHATIQKRQSGTCKHAESLGVDQSQQSLRFIPPAGICNRAYWNDISAAAPNTDFVIYNIPQLAGVALTMNLFAEMRKNQRVIGVKNSSMPVQDIQMFKAAAGDTTDLQRSR